MTKMHIGKWGRSLAVRIPSALVERFNLKEGDPVDMHALEAALTQSRQHKQEEVIERIKSMRWPLPEGYKFDQEEANAR